MRVKEKELEQTRRFWRRGDSGEEAAAWSEEEEEEEEVFIRGGGGGTSVCTWKAQAWSVSCYTRYFMLSMLRTAFYASRVYAGHA